MNTQLQQAREFLAKGDMALVQALAGAVLKEEPQNGEAWFLLSEASEGERKAIFLKKAGKLAPDNEEIQARLATLAGGPPSPPPMPEPEPEPEPELMLVEEEASDDDWADFDMAALADAEDEGEPIDTSAIMVDESPAPRTTTPTAVVEKDPDPEPAPEKATATAVVDDIVSEARSGAMVSSAPTPPTSKAKAKTKEGQAGLNWNYIGMIGFAVLAIVLLLLAIWLAIA